MENKRKIVGIAGGSGSGKSTLAVRLCKEYPEIFALLHVDDYFKKSEETPELHGFKNWDHPDSLRFEDIQGYLLSLQNGESIKIRTKGELYNPEFQYALKNKKEVVIEPKPIIILEGYLALSNPGIRELMDMKIFLEIPIKESIRRRSANKFTPEEEYYEKVLFPMHEQFVEPTKQYADMVIDVLKNNADETYAIVKEKLLAL